MVENYRLSEDEARRRFDEEIAEVFDWEPSEQPVLSVVAAQPGAGKSALQQAVARKRRSTVLDLDNLRSMHPDHEELSRSDDRTAAYLTHADCRRWLDWAFDLALENRSSVVWGCTLSNVDNARARLENFAVAGYVVEAFYLSVHEAQSRMGIVHRYWRERSSNGWGRFTPRQIHDEAYEQLPLSAVNLESDDLLEREYIYKRGNRRLHFNYRHEAGHWRKAINCGDRILRERGRRPWTVRERVNFSHHMNELASAVPLDLQLELGEISEISIPFLISWAEAG
ncbi:zeta toxin family protein [Streptomyces auratus]|uniref:UDP-N-acetylglucosamine kinase n=1 Tax=Streptomyces auratus AGR0001 TaxID=1160718 RepID=A0A8B1NC30_9ACTN|nr:zeta toxin family protein [Streptomyces auratus]QTZ92839.1 zeta toxin family protein [Streptomyces auratus AGR0001]